jgi:RNA polymerase sigma factor (sigma-70 family)
MSNANSLDTLALAHRMRADLIRVARRYVRCPCLAEDIVQDALLRILSNEPPPDIESARAWLCRMVRNLAIDRARRIGAESRMFAVAESEAAYPQPAADGDCPVAGLLARESLRVVESALEQLPERIRAAFLMHRLDGVSQKDVAQKMGVSRALVCDFVRRGHDHCLKALSRVQSGPAAVAVDARGARRSRAKRIRDDAAADHASACPTRRRYDRSSATEIAQAMASASARDAITPSKPQRGGKSASSGSSA